jgi:hypothetical protein
MAGIKGGTSGLIAETGAASGANALHVQQRPISYGSLGHYMVGVITGTMAAGVGADSEIVQFRWTHASNLAVITLAELQFFNSLGTGFAAGLAQFDLTIARSFSAAGTGGGTVTMTGDLQSLRTSMGTSLVGEIRVATTAALGAGTKTLDSERISRMKCTVGTATNTNYLQTPAGVLYRAHDFEHPIVLAQNEGLIVRATVPATGTWEAGIRLGWAEVTAY